MARLKSLCGLAAKNRFPKYGGPPPERVLTPLYNTAESETLSFAQIPGEPTFLLPCRPGKKSFPQFRHLAIA